MDSARTYTSVSRDAITYERNVTTLSAKGFMDALNGAYENSDNKKADISDEIKEEKSKKDAGTLSDNSEGTLGFLNGKYSEIFTRDITKVSNVSFRIDSDLKAQADALFSQLGMNMTTAFNIFLRQSVREGCIPFEITLNTPNSETVAALIEAQQLMNNPDTKKYDIEDALTELKE